MNSFWGVLAPYIFSGVDVKDNKTSATALNLAIAGLFSTQDAKMKGTFQGEGVGAIADSCAYVPFAFNGSVRDSKIYHRVSQYDDPSKTLYMTYGWAKFEKKDGDEYAPLPKTKAERTNRIDWFSSKTAAFVFLDGHVEVLSPPLPDRLYSVKPTTN